MDIEKILKKIYEIYAEQENLNISIEIERK